MYQIGSKVVCNRKKNGKKFEGYVIAKRDGYYIVMDIDDTLKSKEFAESEVQKTDLGYATNINSIININRLADGIKNAIDNKYDLYMVNKEDEE